MKQVWLIQSPGNRRLILFMLGWGATPNAVQQLPFPEGYDVLCCYDHRQLTPLAAGDFAGYERIYLFAWSFGVWVSEQCCRELPLHRAIALNGTPYPVDPRYGMRLRVVQRTIRTGGDNPFAAAGDEAGRYIPTGPYPDRTAEEKLDELNLLAERAAADSTPHLHWNAAYIAPRDEIFPPDHMRAYWHPLHLGTEFDSYHYPFTNPSLILNELK